jgi:hypothetical protein
MCEDQACGVRSASLRLFDPDHGIWERGADFCLGSRAIVLCQVLRFSIDNEGDEVVSSNLGKRIKLIFLAKIPKAYFAASAHHNAASACSGRRIAQSAVAKQPWGGKVLITFVMHTIILSAPRMGIHLYASR